MTYNPASRRTAEEHARYAAIAIAERSQWQVERVGMMLDRRYAGYYHVAAAQLLLIPSTRTLLTEMPMVDRAMRDARSDALIVGTDAAARTVTLALGIWGREENHWHAPMALWVRGDLGLWLVPDPYHSRVRRDCFALVADGRLVARSKPWRSAAQQRQCRNLAAAWIARVMAA